MSISLTMLKILGPAVAKWLLESLQIESDLTNHLLEQSIDFATDESLSVVERQQTITEQANQIACSLQSQMQPLFEREARDLEEGSQNAIFLGVAETLIKARLSSDSLVETNLDAEELKQKLTDANPSASRFFSRNEQALYEMALTFVSHRLIEDAPRIQGFELSITKAQLRKLEEISAYVRSQRERSIQASDEFAKRYRSIVQDKLDQLEIFGLPRMDRLTSQQSLSMAYITLSVSGIENEFKSIYKLSDDQTIQEAVQQKSLRIDKVACNCRRLVIRGGAGAGKSTLLQWMVVRAASGSFEGKLQLWNYKMPFFIRLRSLVNEEFPAPERFPALIARNFAATMPHDWVHQYLNRGQALVLIDGVDELPQRERADFFDALKDLVHDFSDANYIITSRPSGLKDAQGEEWTEWEEWVKKEGFINLHLEPMSFDSVEEFVTRWHQALPVNDSSSNGLEHPLQTAKNLKRQLRQRIELRQLASTPLLCAMICALHRERLETLPSARLQLYRECIEMLLNRRDIGRGIELDETYPIGFNEEQKIAFIQALALWLMRIDRSDIEAERVDKHFEQRLEWMNLPRAVTGKQVRDFFVDRSGLLREPVVGTLDFAHRTFQEYLAAKAALDEDSLEEIIQRATDDQWRECIIVAAGLARTKERKILLESLIKIGNDNSKDRKYLHFLAVACLETATEINPGTRNEVLKNAKALLPPQNQDEVQMVARAGNEVVPLLIYESQYSAQEACMCIDTLISIGTQAAMYALEDYAKAYFSEEGDQYLIGRSIAFGLTAFNQNNFITKVLSNLKTLILQDIEIENSNYLRELNKVNRLHIYYVYLEDFSFLEDLSNLVHLSLIRTNMQDLSALQNLINLESLLLASDYNSSLDISPLEKFSNLKTLLILNSQDLDIASIKKMPKLKSLSLPGCKFIHEHLLSHLIELQSLDLSGAKLTSQLSLHNLICLKALDLSQAKIRNFSFLSSLKQLQELNLSLSSIKDISSLSALFQMQMLYLSSTQVVDVSPLGDLSALQELDISRSQVFDITPLANLSGLQRLKLSETKITDISSLCSLFQLQALDISKSEIIDISPLEKISQLKEINLSKTLVTDVSCLKHLQDLVITVDSNDTDREKAEQWRAMGMEVNVEVDYEDIPF